MKHIIKSRPTKTIYAGMTLISIIGIAPFARGVSFPVTNSKCNIAFVHPKDGGVAYLSKDCNSAYVIPSSTGKVKVEKITRLSNLQLCESLKKAYLREERYKDLLDKVTSRLENEKLSEADLKSIRESAMMIKENIKEVYSSFKGVPGAVAMISFKMPSHSDWVGEYFKLNPNLGADYRLKFHPAPIAESVLTIKTVSEKGERHALDPVIDSFIPGLTPVNNNPNRLNGTGIIMNGGAAGQLTLGLTGSCEYAEGKNSNIQDLVAHMVAQMTYAVPVLSSVGYEAQLDSKTAIQNFLHSVQTKSQFSKSEMTRSFTSGFAGQSFKFNVTNYEIPGVTEKDPLFSNLREEVLKRLTLKLADQIAMTNFVEMSVPPKPANANEPGYVEEVRLRRECSSNSGFLGIGARSRCDDIPYLVRIPHGTGADTLVSKINDTLFSNKESVSVNSTIYRVHTSTFLPDEATK